MPSIDARPLWDLNEEYTYKNLSLLSFHFQLRIYDKHRMKPSKRAKGLGLKICFDFEKYTVHFKKWVVILKILTKTYRFGISLRTTSD